MNSARTCDRPLILLLYLPVSSNTTLLRSSHVRTVKLLDRYMHALSMPSNSVVEQLNCCSSSSATVVVAEEACHYSFAMQPAVHHPYAHGNSQEKRQESNELAWQDQLPTKQEWLQQSWRAANEKTWVRTGEPLDTHTPLAPFFSDKPRARSAHTTHLSSTLTPRRCRRGKSLSEGKRTRRRHFSLEHENLMDVPRASLLCSRDQFWRSSKTGISWRGTDRSNKQTMLAANVARGRCREYYVHPCGGRASLAQSVLLAAM
jgi:hypothetical protein